MTNCESTRADAADIVAQLIGLLADTWLARHVDSPIDRALESFRCDVVVPATHLQFLDTVTKFAEHLSAQRVWGHGAMSRVQARDNAVALVERAYAHAGALAYDEALREAYDEGIGGVAMVLARIAEALKAQAHENHERSIIAARLDPLDWNTRLAVTSFLLERCRAVLPPLPKGACYEAAELVDHIPAFLRLLMDSERLERRFVAAPLAASPETAAPAPPPSG